MKVKHENRPFLTPVNKKYLSRFLERPTRGQLIKLKELGYKGSKPTSKFNAGELIEKLKKGA